MAIPSRTVATLLFSLTFAKMIIMADVVAEVLLIDAQNAPSIALYPH